MLELTESVMVDDLATVLAQLQEIGRLGVRIAVDDFGTGHSSLQWLQRLPFTLLKIDRGFVSGIDAARIDAAIVSATLELARALDLRTVGEGVETPQQLSALVELGCEAVQGFLICGPLTEDDLRAWLAGRGADGGGSSGSDDDRGRTWR